MELWFLNIEADGFVNVAAWAGRHRAFGQIRSLFRAEGPFGPRVCDREVLLQLILVRRRTKPLVNLVKLCAHTKDKL